MPIVNLQNFPFVDGTTPDADQIMDDLYDPVNPATSFETINGALDNVNADPSWPFPGDYTGELKIEGEWWGEWCAGESDFSVDSDANLTGTAECSWEAGYDDGTVEFVFSGSVAEDGSVSGDAEVFIFGDSGVLELEGSHGESDSTLTTAFALGGGGGGGGGGSQAQYVTVERD